MASKKSNVSDTITSEKVKLRTCIILLTEDLNYIGPVQQCYPLNSHYFKYRINLLIRGMEHSLLFKSKNEAVVSRKKLAETLLLFRMWYYKELRRKYNDNNI